MLLLVAVCVMLFGYLLVGIGRHGLDDIGFWLTIVSFMALCFMCAVLAANYIGVDAKVASDTVRYEHLKAQYESDAYKNANKIAQYNLLQQIGDWNQELAKNQKLTHDFWIGIFIPDYYDDLKYIEVDYKEVMKNE